jgi:hypothetical protein
MIFQSRKVNDFDVAIEREEQDIIVSKLKEKNISFSCAQSVNGDLVIISPVHNNISSVNHLFTEIKQLFDNVEIHGLFDDVDENGYNLSVFKECLDINLAS